VAFRYREQAATLKRIIEVQWAFAGLLLLALLGAGLGWHQAVEEQVLHIPPDLRAGAAVRPGEVPPASVYAFAYYLFQQLNRWPEEGSRDYGKQIFALSAYLTPAYRAALEQDLARRGKQGELLGRTRAVHEAPSAAYSEARVEVLGNGSWVVWLDLQLIEHVKGLEVKNTTLRYPLRVVRRDVDRERNPWGLALAGYAETPRRLEGEPQAAAAGTLGAR
jgi:integrating conjugative element protein (TIGR03746 family)